MIAIQRAPVCGQFIIRVIRLIAPKQLHLGRRDSVVWRADTTGPCDGNCRIATLGIGQTRFVIRVLPPAMNVHQSGEFFTVLRVTIHRSDHGFLSFEDTDPITQHLQLYAFFFPLMQDFDIQRFRAGIKVRPQFRMSLWRDPIF